MIARPTSGDGVIPTTELRVILPRIGFDFLLDDLPSITQKLDPQSTGKFT